VSGFPKEFVGGDFDDLSEAYGLLKRDSTDPALDLRNALWMRAEEFCELSLTKASPLSEHTNSLAEFFFREDDVFGWSWQAIS
jgi:hypothetical protein